MKGKAKPSPFVVIVDTREQRPFKFGEITDSRGHALEVTTCRHKLDAGDYSIQGLESLIAVERKTRPDIYSTVGKERERFERELAKLAAMLAPAIVIQCDDDPEEEEEDAEKRKRGKREAQRTDEDKPPCKKAGGCCPIMALMHPPRFSQMHPKSVLNSLFAWSVRQRIPVWLCPDRRTAQALTYRLLQHFWNWRERQRTEEKQ